MDGDEGPDQLSPEAGRRGKAARLPFKHLKHEDKALGQGVYTRKSAVFHHVLGPHEAWLRACRSAISDPPAANS